MYVHVYMFDIHFFQTLKYEIKLLVYLVINK